MYWLNGELIFYFNFIKSVVEVGRAIEVRIRSWKVLAFLFCKEYIVVKSLTIYLLDALVIEPFSAFPVLPESEFFLFLAAGIYKDSESMLLTIEPPALITPAIRPVEEAVPALFILSVLSFIAATVGPVVYSHSIHVVV
jgi:hypothetical protein